MIKAAELSGIKSLQISEGHVELIGYSHGFIGGATGYDDQKLFFAGDHHLHPDGERIEEFCRSLNVEPISLCDDPLSDIGTILFL
jgi:hypothetical protein